MSITFESLGLSEPLLRALSDCGYTQPTPIQAQAIPAVLNGGDLLAGAQTGTGKTAGFTLPILQRLSAAGGDARPRGRDGRERRVIRALVLTPTRELAAQVEESVRSYGKYLSFRSMVMFGGVGIHPQIKQLRDGVDILVATPGRLLDHVGQGTIDLSKVEILVLDEADRMLDMGFIRDIRKILNLLPARRQNLLFSATFSDEIRQLADSLLDRPELIQVARRNATADTVSQRIIAVGRDRKRELLAHMIREQNWFQVLVFTRTKHGANRLAEQLDRDGISAMAIHGNKSQGARTRALSEFKSGDLRVLVATDIAARGIDIVELPHVVNYELPNVPEDYVHRIGRTGRAGAEGEAVSLVCIDELRFLADIERLIKRPLPREVVPGFELDPNDRPEPIELGRGRRLNGSTGRSAGSGGGRGAGGAPRHSTGAPRGHGGARSGGGSAAGNGSGLRAGAGGRPGGGRGPSASADRSSADRGPRGAGGRSEGRGDSRGDGRGPRAGQAPRRPRQS